MPAGWGVPLWMARVMLSAGMFASRAASTADRSRALCSGSPPPLRAATVTSRMSLVKSAPLVAPIASFLRLILVHLLWPAICSPSPPPPAPPPPRPPTGEVGQFHGHRPLQDQFDRRRRLVGKPAAEQALGRRAEHRRTGRHRGVARGVEGLPHCERTSARREQEGNGRRGPEERTHH